MLIAFRTLMIARGGRSARVIDRNGEGSVEVGDATTCEYLPHDVDQIVARCASLLGLTEADEAEYDQLAAEVAALLLPRHVDPAGGPEPEDRLVIRPDSPWRSVPIIGGTESGVWSGYGDADLAAACTCEVDPDSHCPVHGMTRPGMNTPRPPELT